jgi:exopolyphosphatase/guanosine-5'-triphosphate,3'-diphosphate pyrophosphatase
MKLAAIDIGSNSIHLAMVRAVPGQHLEIIDREKEMVRLGAGTLRMHRLSRETIDRAITVLRRYKQMAEANRVDRLITTATAAVRESHNASEFIERVRKEVGLDVQLLPGVEEARLIALAVSEVTEFNGRRALIIDIGGGSTEFIVTGGLEPELLLSLRLGAVRLTEKFITSDPISSEERERLASDIRADLTRVVSEIRRVGFDFVIGTSGTVVNLVSAVVQAEAGPGMEESGFESFNHTVTFDQIARLNRRLARMTVSERGRVPGIEERRADIIVAGGLLLETAMAGVGAESITSCDWSLREGVILDYLHKHSPDARVRRTTHPAISPVATGAVPEHVSDIGDAQELDIRTRSVLSVARRYDYDAPHSHHVAGLAARIFHETRDLHGLDEQECKLLEYAALLHDIGYHIAPNNHHRHSLYLIKNSEMPGFTGNETAIIATVARYHRGSMPAGRADAKARREHEDFKALDREDRKVVLRLASILRIADGLDRAHRQVITDLNIQLSGTGVTLHLVSNGDSELEIWSAERKAEWFRKVFRVSVNFEREPLASGKEESSISAVMP